MSNSITDNNNLIVIVMYMIYKCNNVNIKTKAFLNRLTRPNNLFNFKHTLPKAGLPPQTQEPKLQVY